MLWVTKKRIKVNRAATAWLIKRFIDRDATFLFVEPDDVERIQSEQGARGFDGPGATYRHADDRGRCSFEALVEEHCADDWALRAMGRIVHAADFDVDVDNVPEASGLRAISDGFPLITSDDHATVAGAAFLYDALYASLAARTPR